MVSSERRGWLALGLGASVALHAVVGVWLARAPQPQPPPPGAGAAGVEAIEVQVVPAAAPAPGAREPSPSAPGRRRSTATSIELIPAPSEEIREEAGEGGEAMPEPAAPESTGVESGGGTGTRSTAVLMARLSAAALRCYPPEAVRFRLAGEAQLSFCLGEDGQAKAVKLARSAGSEVLDRAALECVLPGALPIPGTAGCYELPVRFSARRP